MCVLGVQELFLSQFAQDAFAFTQQDKRKAIQFRHLSAAVRHNDLYYFLSDIVPQKITRREAEGRIAKMMSGGQ